MQQPITANLTISALLKRNVSAEIGDVKQTGVESSWPFNVLL